MPWNMSAAKKENKRGKGLAKLASPFFQSNIALLATWTFVVVRAMSVESCVAAMQFVVVTLAAEAGIISQRDSPKHSQRHYPYDESHQ